MENSNSNLIAKRFTDDTYATKDEVRRGLNTTLVDPFWNEILSYRSSYGLRINIKTVANLDYFICMTDSIKTKLNKICEKLTRSVSLFLNLEEELKETVKNHFIKESIFLAGSYYGETLSDDFIKTIINNGANNLQGISEAKKRAIEYFDGYKLIQENVDKFDADFLVKLYLVLSKKENIVSIYRTFNFPNDQSNNVGVQYNGAPFNLIDKLMNQLYQFLNDQRFSSIVKASVAYYYINVMKPFDSHNKEIAMLLFKTIINKDQNNFINYLIPFEELLKHEDDFIKDYKEVNRGNDLTYVLVRIANLSDAIIDKFLDYCTNVKIEDLRREHAPKLEDDPLNEVKSLESPKNDENKQNEIKEKPKHVAIPSIQSGLDEKEAHKFEKYLLERNPRLKRVQAHFYARHCTIGSYYTIQDFKKSEKVVYETARTSMESLTEFGYYKKEQIKNKFVYTPIKIEGK